MGSESRGRGGAVVRKVLVDALRAFVALPDDDWQPHDWHIAMEAKRLAGEELARLDRAASRKPASSGATMRTRRPADGPTDATRDAVMARSGGWCEVAANGCRMKVSHLHHRLGRGQGGGHGVDNLLGVCSSCHDYVHANPTWSYQRGWMLHRVTG